MAERVLAADGSSSVTVVVGDPGIGKSTLWADLLVVAADKGARVLATRPGEAEAQAAWSGLADLLDGVPVAVLDRLPPPQRHALDAACLRADPPTGGIDPRAVWTALRTVVSTLSADGPVLLAVDDLHWLDPATSRAVAFLARRLPATGVAVVAATRPPSGAAGDELLGVPGVHRLDLGPIDLAATAEAVHHHLGTALSRPAAARIHATAGGNPMFAIELARADAPHGGRPPAVPESLQGLVGRRVAALTNEGRTTLAAIAAAGRVTVRQLAAAGLDGGLAEAEGAGLARIDGALAHPSHPLVGASAYAACPAPARRTIHTALAAVMAAPEDSARHAALGSAAPGPDVLAALDEAATSAARRGAVDTAAELATLALELTPEGDPRVLAREMAAGEHRFRGGDSDAARHHFVRVLEAAESSTDRARAALRMAEVAWETEPAEVAASYAERATVLAGDDPMLAAEAEVTLARTLGVIDLEASAVAAARALALLDGVSGEVADAGLLATALLASAEATFELGLGLDRDLFARAADLEAGDPPARIADRASAALASLLKFADDLDGSRAQLQALRRAVDEEGDESSLPFVLGHLVLVELWSGRWDAAEAAAREHLSFAERTGQEAQRRQADYNLAVVAAHRGEEDAAEAIADQLAAEARVDGDSWSEMTAENVLGFAALARGDDPGAVGHLEVSYHLAEAMALREPGRTRTRTDHIEALIAVGAHDRAETLLKEYEARAKAVDRASARGAAARCRALLEAATGDEDAAGRAIDESLAQMARPGADAYVFERARSQLVAGLVHRRARRKRAARLALEDARDTFAALGAQRFVARAEHELSRIGLRPAAPDALSATEQRVAELAARGLSTRQVADAAFLSPKTVEANLTRVYRKLGLRSRAELGAWSARQEEPAG